MLDQKDYVVLQALFARGIGHDTDITDLILRLHSADSPASRLREKEPIFLYLFNLREIGLINYGRKNQTNDQWMRHPEVTASITQRGVEVFTAEELRRSQIETNSAVARAGDMQAKLLRIQMWIVVASLVISIVGVGVTVLTYIDDASRQSIQQRLEEQEREVSRLRLLLEERIVGLSRRVDLVDTSTKGKR